jgi:hypothetical protein
MTKVCHKRFGEAMRTELLGRRDLSYRFRENDCHFRRLSSKDSDPAAPECPAVPRCDLPEMHWGKRTNSLTICFTLHQYNTTRFRKC